jgi:hypothetical protein
MKKLLIVILILVLLLGVLAAAAGLAIYNANRIIARYRPEIEKMAGDILGSDVKLGEIGLELFPPLGICIGGVTLTDRKYPEETMQVEKAVLRMALWPLLQNRLEVSELTLHRPQLTAIMDESGTRIAALQPAETAPDETESTAAMDISMDTIRIQNGELTVEDRINRAEYIIAPFSLTTGVEISAAGIRLTRLEGGLNYLTDFGVDGTGQGYAWESGRMDAGELTTRFLGNEVTVRGALQAGDPSKTVTITSPGVELDSLTPLYDAFAPYVLDYGIKGKVKPDLEFAFTPEGGYTTGGTVTLTNVAASVYGIPLEAISGPVKVQADSRNQRASGTDISAKVNGIPLTADFESEYSGDTAALEKVSIEAFSGTAEGSAKVRMTDAMPFDASMNLAGMALKELAAAFAPDMPVNIEGTLKSAALDIGGTLDDALYSSLKGQGDLEIIDSVLGKVNLAAAILGKVRDLPFLSQSLAAIAPAQFRGALDRDYTILNRVAGSYRIADEAVKTDDLLVSGELFEMQISGTMDFGMNLDLEAVIALSPELSGGLVSVAQPLQAVQDNNGRIRIPLRVTGSVWSPSVKPVMKDLLKGKAGEVKKTVKETAEGSADELVEGLMKGETDTGKTGEKLKKKGKDLVKSFGF